MPTVRIDQDILYAHVVCEDRGAYALIEEALTILAPQAQYTTLYKSGRWDGKMRLFAPRGRYSLMCAAGLATRLEELLAAKGYGVTVTPKATPPPAPPYGDHLWQDPPKGFISKETIPLTLRPYQVAAVNGALARHRCVLQCPTGGGKTEIGAAIIQQLGVPTLWLIHRKELLHQTQQRLTQRLNMPVGMIGSGILTLYPVTVGMVQTLMRFDPRKRQEPGDRREFWTEWKCLIIDECMHASADTWRTVANWCTQAYYRFGLSATPLTSDPIRNLRLEGITGPLLVVADIQDLSQQGFLATPTIVRLRAPRHSYPPYPAVREIVCPGWQRNPRQLSTLGGKLFAEAYRRGIVFNASRNTQLFRTAWGHTQRGEKVLLLCSALAHGEALFAQCKKMISACWWIHGSEPDEVRQTVLRDFQSQTGGAVLIASTILDEGVDLPEIDVLILAGAGESSTRTLQRVGRALRPRLDKHEVLIYDVEDGYDPHDSKDYLARHAQQRFADYQAQGFTIL